MINCPDCNSYNIKNLGKIIGSCFFGARFIDFNFPASMLYECKFCHIKFKNPILDETVLNGLYKNVDSEAWSNSLRNDFKLVHTELEKINLNNKKILDIGCNRGDLLAGLPNGVIRYGVEPNLKQHKECYLNGFKKVWPSLKNAITSGEKFEVIVMTDVLEHITHPSDFLELAASSLTSGGMILLTTGDSDSLLWKLFSQNNWYPFYQEHVSFISRKWLKYFSSKNNLRIEKIQNFRYQKHSMKSYVKHLIMALIMGVSPGLYKIIFRILGYKEKQVFPFGFGLINDHFIVVLRKNGV